MIYEGNWANGQRNGSGVLKHANGEIIREGEWKDHKYVSEE